VLRSLGEDPCLRRDNVIIGMYAARIGRQV